MSSISKKIDYMFVSDKDKHGLVYFVESPNGVMCAGSIVNDKKINALFIADTVEDITRIANEQGITNFKVITTTLFTLCDDWRYFIYQDACRMIVAGDGWLSRAVGEMPAYGSSLTSDPSCTVICARHKEHGWYTQDDAIIIGQDLADVLDEIQMDESIDSDGVEFLCRPLILFAALNEKVWYQGVKYDVREALSHNSYMLSKFIDVDEEAALLNRLKGEQA